MESNIYLINCKTNLHVGSGDSNYGVIDKLVQRDVTTTLPCIHASSLKGAFVEYFEEVLKMKTESDVIFGSGDNKKSPSTTKGALVFHQAILLSIPVRSNYQPYYMAIAPMIAEELVNLADDFKAILPADLKIELSTLSAANPVKYQPTLFTSTIPDGIRIEHFEIFQLSNQTLPVLTKLLGSNIVLLNNDDFKEICSDYHLPVIARNHLVNGESKNLWYEQIVPREARFSFFVSNYGNSKQQTEFDKINDKIVQIGGDATVGYGLCKIQSFNKYHS